MVTKMQKNNMKVTSESMEGFVKIFRGQACWEFYYAKLDGTRLLLYDEKPISEKVIPVGRFSVSCHDGKRGIISYVTAADVANISISDLPYIIKIGVIPRTTSWPGSSMLIMAPNSIERQTWLARLEAAIQQDKGRQYPERYKGKILLSMKENDPLDLNCTLQLNSEVLLLGAEEGLFSLKLQVAGSKPLRIGTTTQVHQIIKLPLIHMALLLTGPDRSLMQCGLRQLKNSAMTTECAEPSISLWPVGKDTVGILTFGAEHLEARTIICAASEKQIVLLSWSILQGRFFPIKRLETSHPCSCMYFSRESIIVGCDKFFEIKFSNLSIEEFLDISDNSLHHIVRGAGAIQNYPVSVLDVAEARMEPEYLLCFRNIGVFVDKHGQRSRSEDIKWSHVPVSIEYQKPYLFIVYFNSVEVMKLTSTSFTEKSKSPVCSPELYLEMNHLRYLGVAEDVGPAVYIGSANTHLLLVEGAVCDNVSAKDGADLNGGDHLGFNFLSSSEDDLADELDLLC